MKTLTMLFFAFAVTILNAQDKMNNEIKMPAIFSDNMVLQQKTLAPVWGYAAPESKIKITGSWGQTTETITDKNGEWKAKIKTPKFGGPYELKIENGNSSKVYKNVLIGEVWLCSGQSNMEMPLGGWPPRDTIWGASKEIPKANYPNIRLFTVTRAYAIEPQKDCIGTWNECTPQTAAAFSATAFFFGKKLSDVLNVPIGLINSSWGGTPVESWISGKELGKIEKYEETFKKIDESKSEFSALNAWLKNHPVIDVNNKPENDKWIGLNFEDSDCANTNYNDSLWHEMDLPKNWETTEVGNFDGVVWFRKNIELPDSMLNKNLVLELGPIDDMDVTFVNGVKVGGYENSGFWQIDRKYVIPSEINKEKNLTIAVRVLDNQGGGGIWGTPDKMKLHIKDSDLSISLAGKWKFLPVAEFVGGKFFVFGAKDEEFFKRPKVGIEISAYTLSSLYNGMIAPLIPYSIKGAIWYQGESNTGNPEEYKTLFPMMIKNWRSDWNEKNFPFYYVQIAPYNYGNETNSQKLREAQLQTLAVPNTGMAVTMDIGNPGNIHPGNKKDVGDRLAFWALAKNYNKKIPYSGPLYKSMKVEKDKAVLSFDFAEGLSIKPREGKNNFLIAGEDKNFHNAVVEVKGKKLFVSSPDVNKPVAVRYCWSDTEEGTLFNKYGLPSSSFRTDNWEK